MPKLWLIWLGKVTVWDWPLLLGQIFTVLQWGQITNGATFQTALWYLHSKNLIELSFVLSFGTPNLTKSTWSTWSNWQKSRVKANFAQSFLVQIKTLPKLIFATPSAPPLKANKSLSMSACTECPELTLLYVHKIMCTCGSTKARLRDSQCSSRRDKWVTENWEEKSVGTLKKSRTSTQFTTWTSLTTQKNARTWFARLQWVSRCW